MMTLRESLHDYLEMRRSLGYKLRSQGCGLVTFVSFMEESQTDFITTAQAIAWAQLPKDVLPVRWERRLSWIRTFAHYCKAMDARTEVPPVSVFPGAYTRPTPYFFTDADIGRLLNAALQLQANHGFFGRSMHCLLGLLSVTGLRISEAFGLTLDDVDLKEGILTIRSSKFGKSRLVPMHPSTVSVLAEYQKCREKILRGRRVPHLFVNSLGVRLLYDRVLDTFHLLTKQIGLHTRMIGDRKPHLHDLRHRFALVTLLNWYRDGQDIERRLPFLSAFLGHVQVSNTYWYLSARPDLLAAARDRLEQRWEKTS
jgi:site-specific recombinase XerD